MILNLLFPKKCLECGVGGVYMCLKCLNKVSLGGWHKNHYSVFKYEGVIRKAILALKYKYATDIAEGLTSACTSKMKLTDVYTLTPVPLHKKRENLRGFNQVELIGKKIAKQKNWKFIPNLLIRTKSTTPQVNLKGSARRTNLSGVFKLNPIYTNQAIPNILIFDDVYTTGSTIKEITKTLGEAGYKDIKTMTIAR